MTAIPQVDGLCIACSGTHGPIDHQAELCLPWVAIGKEVIDIDGDLVATFANKHDAWLVVQAMNRSVT